MTASEKIKTSSNIIKQNKVQYNLDRKTAKISASLSGNVGKYEFLAGEEVLPEKGLLENAATIKRFEYSPLGSELKKQNDIAKTRYQGLNKVYQFDGTINKDDKKPRLKKYNKSGLIYDANHSFYKYQDINNFVCYSLESNSTFLASFSKDFDKLSKVRRQKEKKVKKKNKCV